MAGLVPATQTRRRRKKKRGGGASDKFQATVLLGGRDKPGHDVQKKDQSL